MGFLRQEWEEAKDPFSLDEIQPAAHTARHTERESSHLAAHVRELPDDGEGNIRAVQKLLGGSHKDIVYSLALFDEVRYL